VLCCWHRDDVIRVLPVPAWLHGVLCSGFPRGAVVLSDLQLQPIPANLIVLVGVSKTFEQLVCRDRRSSGCSKQLSVSSITASMRKRIHGIWAPAFVQALLLEPV